MYRLSARSDRRKYYRELPGDADPGSRANNYSPAIRGGRAGRRGAGERAEPTEVREWARAQDIEVNDRGQCRLSWWPDSKRHRRIGPEVTATRGTAVPLTCML